MTQDELRLLHSYADGPRIWDAASIVPGVHSLAEQGYIEPHPDPDRPGVYQLTAEGRTALEEDALRLKDGRVIVPNLYIQRGHALYKASTLYPAEDRITAVVCFDHDGGPLGRTTVRGLTREELVTRWTTASSQIVSKYHAYLDAQR